MKLKFSTYFNKDSYVKDKGTINDMPSLTDESFKAMCEIDQLLLSANCAPRVAPVDRYDMNNYETAHYTFEDWQNQKAKIERKFLHLSKEAREFFKTPQEFFKYCSNPQNYELKQGGDIVVKEDIKASVVSSDVKEAEKVVDKTE